MVGTGPFKFKDWVARRPRHHREEPGLLEQAERRPTSTRSSFKPFADQTAALNALQAGDIDFAPDDRPDRRRDAARRTRTSRSSTAASRATCSTSACRTRRHKPFDNPKIREAIAYAINKQSLHRRVLRGPGQRGRQLDAAGDPVLQGPRPADLRPREGQGPDRRVRRDRRPLAIDFCYPSDVARPYMPDPKGELRGDRHRPRGRRLQDQPEDRGRGAPATSTTERPASTRCGCIGWTCDWAGPDNFLITACSSTTATGRRTRSSATDRRSSRPRSTPPSAATNEADATAAWSRPRTSSGADLPTVPILNSTPPGAARKTLNGLPGQRQPDRVLQHGLARPSSQSNADTARAPSGPDGPGGARLPPDAARTDLRTCAGTSFAG